MRNHTLHSSGKCLILVVVFGLFGLLSTETSGYVAIHSTWSDSPKNEGSFVNFAATVESDHPPITYTMDFGDGEPPESGSMTPGDIYFEHPYGDNGIYYATLSVENSQGETNAYQYMVMLFNVPPTVDAGDDQFGSVGQFLAFDGVFTDPGWKDTHTATWDFRDGSPLQDGTISEENDPPDSSGTVQGAHTYTLPGVYSVTLTVHDGDGIGADTMKVFVEPLLCLLEPNGGEALVDDAIYTVRWEIQPDVNDILLDYSTDNGSTWAPVDPPNTGNNGSYEWLVPIVDSNECLMRISDANNPNNFDVSDDVFTIYECTLPDFVDLDGDCLVNMVDFGILASYWLQCGNPYDPNCIE